MEENIYAKMLFVTGLKVLVSTYSNWSLFNFLTNWQNRGTLLKMCMHSGFALSTLLWTPMTQLSLHILYLKICMYGSGQHMGVPGRNWPKIKFLIPFSSLWLTLLNIVIWVFHLWFFVLTLFIMRFCIPTCGIYERRSKWQLICPKVPWETIIQERKLLLCKAKKSCIVSV